MTQQRKGVVPIQQNKNKGRYSEMLAQDQRRRIQIRNWIILLLAVALIAFGIRWVRNIGNTAEISYVSFPCTADQSVTPFGNSVLYYDGTSIHCLGESGGIRWSFPVGIGAKFSVSDTHLVIWSGTQLFIVDSNGHPSYNENMSGEVQFARIGSHYCAAVIGDDTEPDLVVKNLDGTPIDEEYEAFSGMMLLDVGFFGEADQYMWTLSMDVFGTAINTVLNTFQVGKMNTGIVNLGEFLAYKVLFEDNHLRVFTTQQMYTFDYKAVRDMTSSRLVYGWQLIDSYIPDRGPAYMLLAPTAQMTGSQNITELRVFTGTQDRRYTLPSTCIGAAIQGRNLYAISGDYLYRSDIDTQRFYGYALPLPDNRSATSLIGLTKGGRAIIASGTQVYSVALPQ